MQVSLSGMVITAGTPAGESCVLDGGKGDRNVEVRNYIGSESPGIYDLGNVLLEDTLIAEWQFDDPISAYVGYAKKRNALLGLANGDLSYNGNIVATDALARSVSVVQWRGVGVTVRIEVVGVRPQN